MNIVLNSSIIMCDSVKKNDDAVDISNKCLELQAEFVKKNNAYNEVSKCDLKAQLQAKDTVISKLKEIIHSLRESVNPAKVKQDIDEIDTINIELEHNLKTQIQEKAFANAALKMKLKKLKGKNVIDIVDLKPYATTIALGMFKLDLESLAPKVLKNKDAHLDYIKHSREHANTLREIVQSARALSPLNSNLDSACKYVQRIQEVLVYARDIFPCLTRPSKTLVTVTPKNKDKKVRFADPVTSSSNTQKQVNSYKPKDSNQPLFHSTRVIGSTGARGSKPMGNTRKNRILQSSMPLKETTTKSVLTPTQGIKVYSRRPKATKSVGSSSKSKIIESRISNQSKPTQTGESTISNVSSSSLIDCKLSKFFCGYGDYHIGNITISTVYYVKGLGHNLFSVGQFCDSDLEVAFRKHTCFVRNLKGVDLLLGSQGTHLYTLSIGDMMKSSLICLLSKASKTKSWLWHQRLSHLNFGTINQLAKQGLVRGLPKLKFEKDHLCSACLLEKSKKQSHKLKSKDTNQEKLYLLHMDLYGPMRVESINGKKYILVIVDDYSWFTWVKFVRSKDEAPEFIIKFLKMIQVRLYATVMNIHTDNGTEFVINIKSMS
ncbi:retrovirus-related pol polyprotein from transposon TNT 1-94 [Tanacetum coccineum]